MVVHIIIIIGDFMEEDVQVMKQPAYTPDLSWVILSCYQGDSSLPLIDRDTGIWFTGLNPQFNWQHAQEVCCMHLSKWGHAQYWNVLCLWIQLNHVSAWCSWSCHIQFLHIIVHTSVTHGPQLNNLTTDIQLCTVIIRSHSQVKRRRWMPMTYIK